MVCAYMHSRTLLCSCDRVESQEVMRSEDTLFVLNKIDLLPRPDTCPARHSAPNVCWLSCKTGLGVDEFMATLQEKAAEMCVSAAVTRHMTVT